MLELKGYLTPLTRHKCPLTNMVATGLPPHTVLALEMVGLRDDIRRLEKTIDDNAKAHSEKLDEMKALLPELIVNMIIEKVQIDGVRQVTHEDLDALRRSIVEEFRRVIDAAPANGGAAQVALADEHANVVMNQVAEGAMAAPDYLGGPKFSSWCWKGRIHPVPKGWAFPYKNLTAKHLWDLWFFGIPAERIPPFRFFPLSMSLEITLSIYVHVV
jgi:hypothetical protein